MTQRSAPVSLNESRLVRFLADFEVSDVAVSHKNFTARLGGLIGLSASIKLSTVLEKLPVRVFEPRVVSGEVVKEEFLREQKEIVQYLIESFVSSGAARRIKLPVPKAGAQREELMDYEPYQRFYAIRQREMSSRVQRLRVNIRESVSGLSPELAQLSVLDAALDEMFSQHSQKSFSAIPRLLEKRFRYLLDEHQRAHCGQETDDPQRWIQAGGWLEKFYVEMQGLLLAELDVRLQPVLGLIEALNNEED